MATSLFVSARFYSTNQALGSCNTQKFRTRVSLQLSDLQKGHPNLRNADRGHSFCAFSSATAPGPRLVVRAVYGNGGVGRDEGGVAAAVAVAEEASKTLELKQTLEDTIHSTERGLQVNAETRSEIMELIGQLESHNPHPNPLQCLDLLDGKWILRYTSLTEFLPLLAAGSLPFIKVGEISQSLNTKDSLMVNSVAFVGPLGTTSLSANASFEICSPKRIQIKFEEGLVEAPQINNVLEMPESFTFLGQKVDLTAFQGIFQTLQSATYTIARTISGQPPLKFPIRSENAQPWLLTTYLDEDLRISRGDNGSVFVFVKDVSALSE